MSFYSYSWEKFFYGLRYGMPNVLPIHRLANRALLLAIDDALQQQSQLTRFDGIHLNTWKTLADTTTISAIDSVKTACDVEAYLAMTCPQVAPRAIKHAMRWLVYLLAKTGIITSNLAKLDEEIRLWRRVNQFKPIEQGFCTGLIDWMAQRQFSINDQHMTLRYYQRLNQWMVKIDIESLGELTDETLYHFLRDCYGHNKMASQQRIKASLRPLFAFYKQTINYGYVIPHHAILVPRCLGGETVVPAKVLKTINICLQSKQWDNTTRLMLALVLGHGLPLKALALLTVVCANTATFAWQRQRPNRTGQETCNVILNLPTPWLGYLWRQYLEKYPKQKGDYLFATQKSAKNNRPMHTDTIQRRIQRVIKETLGYRVTVGQLMRGAIKQQARTQPLDAFMHQTDLVPLSKRTRLMKWVAQNV